MRSLDTSPLIVVLFVTLHEILVFISKKDDAGHTGKSKEIPDGYEMNYGAPEFPWQAFLRADTYSVNPIKLKEQQSPESYK